MAYNLNLFKIETLIRQMRMVKSFFLKLQKKEVREKDEDRPKQCQTNHDSI